MLFTYIILGLSVSFAPLASGLPASLDRSVPAASAEPASLLGRQYSVQDRRQDISPDLLVASRPNSDSTDVARRLVPYAKFLADRSDESWLRMRERRADDADGNVNYLSNVSAYSPPKPFAPPPPPSVTVHPPPTVTTPNITVTGPPLAAGTAKPKLPKNAQKKHTSQAKTTKEKAHKEGNQARAD